MKAQLSVKCLNVKWLNSQFWLSVTECSTQYKISDSAWNAQSLNIQSTLHDVKCFNMIENAQQCRVECLWLIILWWVKHSRVESQNQAFHRKSSISYISDSEFSIHAAEQAFYIFHIMIKHFMLGQTFHTRSSISCMKMKSLESDYENS